MAGDDFIASFARHGTKPYFINEGVSYIILFKYLIPSPIDSEPTDKTYKRLKTELCVNDSSVDTINYSPNLYRDGCNKNRKLRNVTVDIHGKEHEWKRSNDDFYDPMSYCLRHGFRCRIGHNSSACGNKKKGCIDTAICANTQNENQAHQSCN